MSHVALGNGSGRPPRTSTSAMSLREVIAFPFASLAAFAVTVLTWVLS